MREGEVKMKKLLIKTDSELQNFRDKFNSFSPNPVALTYLQQSSVYGCYLRNELVAGYTVNTQAPFRYIDWLPEGSIRENILKKYYVDNKTAECCCLWISKTQVTKFQRNFIYMFLMYDLLKTGRHYIFGGTTASKVGAYHSQALNHTVYKGPLTLPKRPEGQIYYTTWATLLKFITLSYFKETYHDIMNKFRRKNENLKTPLG